MAGVRAGDPAAWDAFFVRFEPVLVRDARRLGVPDAVRDDLVCETLGAVLEQLADPEQVVPGALAGYVRVALRHRAHNYARGERRRALRHAAALERAGDGTAVVASAVSAYTLGLTEGPGVDALRPCTHGAADFPRGDADTDDADPGRVCDPVRTLVRVLEAELRPGERALLEAQQAGATHRALAAERGVTPSAVAKCLTRLRARLHAAAEAYAAGLAGEARREVCRFLGRARGVSPEHVAPGRVALELRPQHVGAPSKGAAATDHASACPARTPHDATAASPRSP